MTSEYLVPIRPGAPGKSPFWNGHASRLMYVPSFDFPAASGGRTYRFRAVSEADGKEYSFTAEQPWAPLTPIWEQLPVGHTQDLLNRLTILLSRALTSTPPLPKGGVHER